MKVLFFAADNGYRDASAGGPITVPDGRRLRLPALPRDRPRPGVRGGRDHGRRVVHLVLLARAGRQRRAADRAQRRRRARRRADVRGREPPPSPRTSGPDRRLTRPRGRLTRGAPAGNRNAPAGDRGVGGVVESPTTRPSWPSSSSARPSRRRPSRPSPSRRWPSRRPSAAALVADALAAGLLGRRRLRGRPWRLVVVGRSRPAPRPAASACAVSARVDFDSAARALPAAVWAPLALTALPAAMRALAALTAAALPVDLAT